MNLLNFIDQISTIDHIWLVEHNFDQKIKSWLFDMLSWRFPQLNQIIDHLSNLTSFD